MKKIFLLVVTTFVIALSFGQTTIFNISGGGSLPAGWVGTNNISSLTIDQNTYYLLESGAISDVVTTAIYDLSNYSSVTFSLDVATYGVASSDNAAKIEISFDGGSTFTQVEISNTPSEASPYIDGGSFNLSSMTNQVQIKISNNGTSGRGVRLKNLKLVSNDIVPPTNSLVITGVYDGPLTGGLPKGIELYVINDIPDLSIFGVGSANNGDGTDGEEFTFPAIPANAGDYIYVASEAVDFNGFFGFSPDYTNSVVNINGDDAIELFENGIVIDIFGDISTDGTDQPWEYLDGWSYRNTAGPSTVFNPLEWDYSGINALDDETTNATATTPFPIGTFAASVLSVVKNEIEGFNLYPNPVSNGLIQISSNSKKNINIEIYSLIGQHIITKKAQVNKPINISNLERGVYFVRIEEEGRIATRKLIVD